MLLFGSGRQEKEERAPLRAGAPSPEVEQAPARPVQATATVAVPPTRGAALALVPTPPGCEVRDRGDSLELVVPRFHLDRSKGGGILILCILSALVVFIVGWSIALVGVLLKATDYGDYAFSIGSLLFAVIGLYVTYRAAAGLVHHFVISVDAREVRVRGVPCYPSLPRAPIRPRVVPADGMQQLYCLRSIDRTGMKYSVYAILPPDRDHPRPYSVLIVTVKALLVARFVENELERFLGIEDWPVEGEVHRFRPRTFASSQTAQLVSSRLVNARTSSQTARLVAPADTASAEVLPV